MTLVAPEERLRLLKELASRFPALQSSIGMDLVWANEFGRAGISTGDEGVSVFLNAASESVSTIAEAEELLRGIFSDNLVAVTGFEGGSVAFCQLARADDPSARFPTPGRWGSGRTVPDVDDVMIETWSSGVQEKE